MNLEEAQELLEQRRQEIAPYLSQETQIPRARLYELLADLTDEDGAYSELEDLRDAANWLLTDSAGNAPDKTDQDNDLPPIKPLFDDELD